MPIQRNEKPATKPAKKQTQNKPTAKAETVPATVDQPLDVAVELEARKNLGDYQHVVCKVKVHGDTSMHSLAGMEDIVVASVKRTIDKAMSIYDRPLAQTIEDEIPYEVPAGADTAGDVPVSDDEVGIPEVEVPEEKVAEAGADLVNEIPEQEEVTIGGQTSDAADENIVIDEDAEPADNGAVELDEGAGGIEGISDEELLGMGDQDSDGGEPTGEESTGEEEITIDDEEPGGEVPAESAGAATSSDAALDDLFMD